MGINLRVRSLDSSLKSVLNEFKDVPIEMQRIILSGIMDYIDREADLVVQHEMDEYTKAQKDKEVVDNA